MLICIFFVIYFYIYIYLFTLFYGISFFGTLIVFSLQKKNYVHMGYLEEKKNFFQSHYGCLVGPKLWFI